MDLSYILNQLGEDRESYRNAVAPPIFQSSIFAHATVATMRVGLQDELNNFYTRGNNPTVEILRKKNAAPKSYACRNYVIAKHFRNALQRFLMVVSWGGLRIAGIFGGLRFSGGRAVASAARYAAKRLSIGLEEAEVLSVDLDQALAQI